MSGKRPKLTLGGYLFFFVVALTLGYVALFDRDAIASMVPFAIFGGLYGLFLHFREEDK